MFLETLAPFLSYILFLSTLFWFITIPLGGIVYYELVKIKRNQRKQHNTTSN